MGEITLVPDEPALIQNSIYEYLRVFGPMPLREILLPFCEKGWENQAHRTVFRLVDALALKHFGPEGKIGVNRDWRFKGGDEWEPQSPAGPPALELALTGVP